MIPAAFRLIFLLQILPSLFWMTRGSIYRCGRPNSRLKLREVAWHVRGAHKPAFSKSVPSLGSIRNEFRIDQRSIQSRRNLVWTFFNMHVNYCKNFMGFGSVDWKLWSVRNWCLRPSVGSNRWSGLVRIDLFDSSTSNRSQGASLRVDPVFCVWLDSKWVFESMGMVFVRIDPNVLPWIDSKLS